MAKMIKRFLAEGGQQTSLFGTRRVLEAMDAGDWTDHLTNAIACLSKQGDAASHAKAKQLMALLRDEGEGEDLEESDQLDDQSQAGRGKPEKSGFRNTTRNDKGLENMESRRGGRGNLTESRDRRGRLTAYGWAQRLLNGK
jgi:hypothetical protein